MPSSDAEDSSKSLPPLKDSGSASANKDNKSGSLSSFANKNKSTFSNKSNNDNQKPQNKNKPNKRKNYDDKSLSPTLPRPFSSSHFALYPPWNSSSSSEKYGSRGYNINNVIITGADIGAVLLLLLMIACILCCCHMKKKRQRNDNNLNNTSEIKVDTNNGYYSTQHAGDQHQQRGDLHLKMPPQPQSDPGSSNQQGWVAAPPLAMVGSSEKNVFTYDDLATATKGFHSSLLLGQGGFGYVHKGVLPNGKEVAVKSLKLGIGQGDREFQAEVETMSHIRYPHLVSLVGYCITGQQRMLVYEFIPNKTLEYHLHGEGCPIMDYTRRFKLALGAAKGLAYLHEDCNPHIVHRNIKAANILLDHLYEAKVVDYGLAKLSSETITHVSTRIMGTFGYLAPEYASMGKLTEKSDVYSYGVVLLELISGRRPIYRHSDEESLIDWARPLLMHASDGVNLEKMVDPRIIEKYNRDKMHRMVACAAACIRHSPRIRPKMSQIVRVLEGKVSTSDLKI